MSLPDVAMVFAAGFGTRMGALTRDTPKPLLKVGGKTLLDHALDRLVAGGIARAVVNTHYQAYQIAGALASRTAPSLLLSHEPEILETGGGMLTRMKPGKFSLNVLWNEMNAAGTLFGAVCDRPWIDVGTPQGLTAAESVFLGEG